MISGKYTLSSSWIEAVGGTGFMAIRGDRHGLTLADVFADHAFVSGWSPVTIPSVVRIYAVDGRCWAEITGATVHGTLIIEPDHMPGSSASPLVPVRPVRNREAARERMARVRAAKAPRAPAAPPT